ncbi:MAG: hypothetical protein IPK14_24040 [Blastocatellia bacterium]|nr:hypothetical protein [Blastocatellia bacterium]MBL8195824.1 hypothetical protein [Blastocatellia bacterium]
MSQTVVSKQDAGLVKGNVLLSLLAYIFKELDQQQKEKFISQISSEYKDKIINNNILPTHKVSVSTLNELTIMAATIKGKPIRLFARDAGRFSAEIGMKSTYNIYSKIRTPNVHLAKASIIWSSLYDKGQMETLRVDKGKSIVKLTNIPTQPVMCDRIYGWLERTNQLNGLENVKVFHTKCFSLSCSHCEWEISWQKPSKL